MVFSDNVEFRYSQKRSTSVAHIRQMNCPHRQILEVNVDTRMAGRMGFSGRVAWLSCSLAAATFDTAAPSS